MKILDAILLSFSAVFFIIGVHQTMLTGESVQQGVANAYFFYMLSLLLVFWYRVRRKQRNQEEQKQQQKRKSAKNPKKRRTKWGETTKFTPFR